MTVPVPLTDIERRNYWPIGKGQFHYVTLRQPERDALCEALRIAAEALNDAAEALGMAKRGLDVAGVHIGHDITHHNESSAREALARIRGLVDLGESG